MTQIEIRSPKHCAEKQAGFYENLDKPKLYKKLFFAFSTLFTTLLSLILLIYLLLHPTKPRFSLQQAQIYQLNLSTNPQLINSSIQLTLVATNPNTKVGIYYDGLQVYVAYKGQQITLHSPLPPFYQGHQDTNLLTASLMGTSIPVAPSFGYEVDRDQSAGKLAITVKANGKIRWKVGTWVSGNYPIIVNCVAVMDFGPAIPTGPLSSKQGSQCSTSL
ncbi:hypothetical protein BT93_L0162 [Corymbia citriodora subsp. variegata]|uniref:Late embryogenesis abundant protein LEA-2 subgroup domain-containing protein n=1 Tax=Corymbia citriodora subsp. variegata TaxID=360336 RepID=A0A8T0CSY7_CORYI|nr:hypothetical protein BT93_L0162 [Corymbia citriodora subsp. variegata]